MEQSADLESMTEEGKWSIYRPALPKSKTHFLNPLFLIQAASFLF